jgi:hypothetical protein
MQTAMYGATTLAQKRAVGTRVSLFETVSPLVAQQALLEIEDIGCFFDRLLTWTGMRRSDVIRKANISRTYGFQILNGTRVAKRDYYLAIAIAMQLDLDTTQWMLAICGVGVLYEPIRRDAAIIIAIQNGYDSYRLYDLLCTHNLAPLDTGIS